MCINNFPELGFGVKKGCDTVETAGKYRGEYQETETLLASAPTLNSAVSLGISPSCFSLRKDPLPLVGGELAVTPGSLQAPTLSSRSVIWARVPGGGGRRPKTSAVHGRICEGSPPWFGPACGEPFGDDRFFILATAFCLVCWGGRHKRF